jgi:RNA polymerase sigma-70 factor (ECF subfamily)
MSHLAEVERLYREHGEVVLRRARRLLGNEELARETLQEVFAAMVESAGPARLPDPGGAVPWLYAVTTNRCLNRLRNERARSRLVAAAWPAEAVGQAMANVDVDVASMARDLLRRLPEELAEVAVYHFIDEMTQDEIAVVLRCSRRHVGNLVRRLRDQISREVRKENIA